MRYCFKLFIFVNLLVLIFIGESFGSVETKITVPQEKAANLQTLTGPTIFLDYGQGKPALNPVDNFMYFVPLISRTLVETKKNSGNSQQSRVISYKKFVDSATFRVCCEFEMNGNGFYTTFFEPNAMIKDYRQYTKKGKDLKHMLDFIKFEGQCFGVIEIKGKLSQAAETIEEVKIHFNHKNHKSPVTIGIYGVRYVNGDYQYAN